LTVNPSPLAPYQHFAEEYIYEGGFSIRSLSLERGKSGRQGTSCYSPDFHDSHIPCIQLFTDIQRLQMTESTFRTNKKGEAYDPDEESGSERSTAAPSSLSQVTGPTGSRTSTTGDSHIKPFDKSVSEAIESHFSAMETVAARSLARKEGDVTHAVTRDSKILEKAEKLLQARDQVPLQGIEFHKYIVDRSQMWFYRVYHGSPANFAGFLTWRTSPGLLVQDFKDECKKPSNQGVVAAQLTRIWHHLERMQDGDWTTWDSFEEFHEKYFPKPVVHHADEGKAPI
jgi:hypothetical protein